MSITRKLGISFAGALLSATGAGALAAPAHADVTASNCAWSYNYSPPRVAATCTDTTQSAWHVYAVCEHFYGKDVTVQGTETYGSGTSIADCPWNTEMIGNGLVNG